MNTYCFHIFLTLTSANEMDPTRIFIKRFKWLFFHRVHEMRDENNELPGNFLSELYKWALECEC